MVTDTSANVTSFHDYLRFGEELPGTTVGRSTPFGPGADGVNQKFTGTERRYGIELVKKTKKGQFKIGKLPGKPVTAPEIWAAVLNA